MLGDDLAVPHHKHPVADPQILELAADRWFVPAEEGIGEDRRRLSYRLTELVQVS